MAEPDHDTESQMADTAPDESGHDAARPLSDEGGPGRGSLATEAAAGTRGRRGCRLARGLGKRRHSSCRCSGRPAPRRSCGGWRPHRGGRDHSGPTPRCARRPGRARRRPCCRFCGTSTTPQGLQIRSHRRARAVGPAATTAAKASPQPPARHGASLAGSSRTLRARPGIAATIFSMVFQLRAVATTRTASRYDSIAAPSGVKRPPPSIAMASGLWSSPSRLDRRAPGHEVAPRRRLLARSSTPRTWTTQIDVA